MPYTPHNWIAGDAANASRFNNLEQQFLQALTSINKDLIGAGFVLSGYTAAKDGTIANQLDVAAGRAYLIQPGSNNDLGLIALGATTQTTATPSTTYHLYLQPDASWYWSTSNSPAANSLAICNVTTDGSGNIATVTDQRTLNATLLSTLSGGLGLPKHASVGGQATAGSFGVPVIVGVLNPTHVTVTTLQTLLTFTVPTTGLYRVSLHITAQPGVNSALLARIVYVDGNNPGSGIFGYFSFASSGSPTTLDGTHSMGMPQSISTMPLVGYMNAGAGTLHIDYQSPSGTPNDYVSGIVERLM